MKHFTGSDSRFYKIGAYIKRFAVTFLVIASFALMLLGKADTIIVEKLQIIANEAATPIMLILSEPAIKLAKILDNLKELGRIRKENAKLRLENQRLKKWQETSRILEHENKMLSALLDYEHAPSGKYYSARIIAEKGGAFARSAIAYMGKTNKAKKGMTVVTENGLVGRIDMTGGLSARVLLITDISSKIPVIAEDSRTKAILAGNNTEFPQLISVLDNAKIAEGERIVTSDITGTFPQGIPVGIVVSSDDSMIKVQPFVDFTRLEYIKIIDFNQSGILPEEVSCRNRNIEKQ